jgi:hypothetical protein
VHTICQQLSFPSSFALQADSEARVHGAVQGPSRGDGQGRQNGCGGGARPGAGGADPAQLGEARRQDKLHEGAKDITPEQMELSCLRAENSRLKLEVRDVEKLMLLHSSFIHLFIRASHPSR